MDGALPPIPAQPGYAPQPGGYVPQVQRSGVPNPVGRPSGDPEVNEARADKAAEKKRLASVLPKQATDSKILVLRMKGSRVIPGKRPVLTLLISDVESAVSAGTSAEDFIADKLAEKVGNRDGRYLCKVVNRLGQAVADTAPWEIIVGADDEDDDGDENGDDGDDEEIDPRDLMGYPFRGGAAAAQMAPPPYAIPPAPPAGFDPASLARTMREERTDESKRSNEMLLVMTTMMQANAQTQANAQAQMQAQQQAFQQQQQQMREEARREENARMDREAARRAEFKTTLVALVPMVLPILTKFFTPKEGPDVLTTYLLESMKSKSPDSTILAQMAGVMGEMTKQQMTLQGTAAASAVNMQAEASNMVFKNMMGTMKEMMDHKAGKGDDEKESTLDQIVRMAPMVLQAMSNPTQAAAAAPAQPPAAPAAHIAPPPAPPAAPRKRQAPKPVVAEPTEGQRIISALNDIRRLSTGEIPAAQRWLVLDYVRKQLPVPIVAAIQAGDKNTVLLTALPHVQNMKSDTLRVWAADAENMQFLEDALSDLRAGLNDQMTEEGAASAIAANTTFVERKHPKPVTTPVESVAKEKPVVAPVAPIEATVVDPSLAPPIPGPGSTRGKRASKRQPPVASKAEGSSLTGMPTVGGEPPVTPGG